MTIAYAAPEAISRDRQTRRAAIAGSVCSTIEWYDLFLAAVLSGLLVRLNFPQTMAGPSVFALWLGLAPLLARLVGAAIFGHAGDRIGRKQAMLTALLLISAATVMLSMLPDYAMLGSWSAIGLVALRCIQGIAIGGAWAGNVLLPLEWAKPGKAGLFASWPQIGIPAGFAIAQISVIIFQQLFGAEFSISGWRILFMLGGCGGALAAFFIWQNIDETPTFTDHRGDGPSPLLTAISRSSWEICLVAVVRVAELFAFFIFTGFLFVYPPVRAALPAVQILGAILAACLAAVALIPVFGALSDRVGRLTIYLSGAVAVAVWGFAAIALLQTAVPALMLATIAFSLVPYAMMVGPQAALIAESFTSPTRYSGTSLGTQLGALIANALGPLAAAMLLANFKSGYAIAVLLLVCAGTGGAAAALLRSEEMLNRLMSAAEAWIRSGRAEATIDKLPTELLPRELTKTFSDLARATKTVLGDNAKGLRDVLRNMRTLASSESVGSETAAKPPPPQRPAEPARRLNAWLDVAMPEVAEFFHILINIGAPVAGAVGSEPLPELDWHGIESLDLIIALTCIDCEIIPFWQKLTLPRTGDSATIKFEILLPNAGTYDFTVRVYLAKQMIQLQSLSFSITAERVQLRAAGAAS